MNNNLTQQQVTTREHRQDLSSILNELGCNNAISSTFKRMEIAEQEIARAVQKHPMKAILLSKTFKYLVPSTWLKDCHDRVYRYHCRELLSRRAKSGESSNLEIPTKAEACMMISKFSLEVKPTRRIQSLYAELFLKIFPEKEEEIPRIEEEWKGSNAEILRELQRKHQVKRS